MLTLGLAGIAVTVAAVVIHRWMKQAKARKGPRPRSPVSWLRTFGRAHARPTNGAATTALKS
jgi:hypothetical protein